MHGLQKYKWGIVTVIILLLIISLIIWLKPAAKAPNTQSQTLTQENNHLATTLPNTATADEKTASVQSASQQDTEINCQLSVDANNRLVVNEQTKNCFEYFITQYGEKSMEQLQADFVRYAKATYQEPLLSQLLDLWERYIKYRNQLGDIAKPTVDPESSKYYREIFNSMAQLRKRFFSDYEIEGLFGQESTYDQYTLDRMDIYDNKSLSEKEKAEKLKALFETLPEDLQENLKQLNQLEDLRKLTSEIKGRNGSSEELRQMRLNLVGPEATQRLEKLDGERSTWKNKVNQYLSERDVINQSTMGENAKQQAISALRQKHFNNPQEQLRVETFETVHDQGGKLPFPD